MILSILLFYCDWEKFFIDYDDFRRDEYYYSALQMLILMALRCSYSLWASRCSSSHYFFSFSMRFWLKVHYYLMFFSYTTRLLICYSRLWDYAESLWILTSIFDDSRLCSFNVTFVFITFLSNSSLSRHVSLSSFSTSSVNLFRRQLS
jgi:hypothetical protein